MAAGRELVFPGASPVIGGGRLLPSPSQFYLTGEDRLRVVCCNSKAGVILKVQWRTALFSGEIVPNSETHTPTSDRTVYTEDLELGTGSLLNITVFAAAGSPLIGQTYVMVQLVRGVGAAAIVLGTLLAGYVTTTQALGFPGSPILSSVEGGAAYRRITGTTPAAGAEISEVVPNGARWQLLTVNALLTTSAAAGTRTPNLVITDGGVDYFGSGQPVGVGASAGSPYWWEQGMALAVQVGLIGSVAGLLIEGHMLAGHRFITRTSNLQAGDQWSAPSYLVREWLEVS